MKTKPVMAATAVFPDVRHRPDDAALKAALGRAAAPFEKAMRKLHLAVPGITCVWQFSERLGWYQIHQLKKRRVLYLVPERGNFRASLILGRKAVAELQPGPYAGKVATLLETARHYPEGISFSFDRQALDPDLLTALIVAKITH